MGGDLRFGKSTGCGCEKALGLADRSRTHGSTGTRLYSIWQNMRARTGNPSNPGFKDYGSRGIRVCAEWDDFAAFEAWALPAGYRDDLSIERVDVDGNYTPENCTWATQLTQARNRRFVKKREDGMTWAEYAEAHGVPNRIFNSRYYMGGWDPEVAATWPVGKRLNAHTKGADGKFVATKNLWRR